MCSKLCNYLYTWWSTHCLRQVTLKRYLYCLAVNPVFQPLDQNCLILIVYLMYIRFIPPFLLINLHHLLASSPSQPTSISFQETQLFTELKPVSTNPVIEKKSNKKFSTGEICGYKCHYTMSNMNIAWGLHANLKINFVIQYKPTAIQRLFFTS